MLLNIHCIDFVTSENWLLYWGSKTALTYSVPRYLNPADFYKMNIVCCYLIVGYIWFKLTALQQSSMCGMNELFTPLTEFWLIACSSKIFWNISPGHKLQSYIFYQLHISMLKPLQDNWLHKHSWNRMKYKHVEHNYPLGNSIWIFMINNLLSLTVGPYSVNPKCTVLIKIPENLQVNTNTNKMLNPQTSSSCFYFSAALPTFTKEQQSGTTKMTKSIAFPSSFPTNGMLAKRNGSNKQRSLIAKDNVTKMLCLNIDKFYSLNRLI